MDVTDKRDNSCLAHAQGNHLAPSSFHVVSDVAPGTGQIRDGLFNMRKGCSCVFSHSNDISFIARVRGSGQDSRIRIYHLAPVE